MSAEYDFLAGLDISSLASVTQAQLLQMVNQMAPLTNRGVVLCFSGAAGGAAGVGYPDVANNPRFVRCLWLDTQSANLPVLKSYKGTYTGTPANPSGMSNLYTDWQGASTIGAAEITTIMLTVVSPTGGVWLGQVKRAADGSASAPNAYDLVIVDGAGQYITNYSFTNYLANRGGILAAEINLFPSGGPGKYLGWDTSGPSIAAGFKYLNPTADITAALGNQIPPSSMQPSGVNGQVLTTSAGAVSWQPSGGVGGGLVETIYAPGTRLNNGTFYIETSQLTAFPKVRRLVVVCMVDDVGPGYFVGDELDIASFINTNGSFLTTLVFTVLNYINGVNYFTRLVFNASAQTRIWNRTGTVNQQVTLANWAPKMYLYT